MAYQLFETLVASYGQETMIKILSSFVTFERMERMKRVSQNRLSTLCVATEGIWDLHNAFAVVRSAEAFGASSVTLVDCDYKKGAGKQTMRGTDEWMRVQEQEGWELFEQAMGKKGFQLAGACPRGDLELNDLPIDGKVCLLFGNEHRGLSEKARSSCRYLYRIPMVGMVESLNLSVAAAISLYSVSSRMRANNLGKDPAHAQDTLAYFLVSSIGLNRCKQILELQTKARTS